MNTATTRTLLKQTESCAHNHDDHDRYGDDDDDDGNDLSGDCGAVHFCLGGSVYGNCLQGAGHGGPHYCGTCASYF